MTCVIFLASAALRPAEAFLALRYPWYNRPQHLGDGWRSTRQRVRRKRLWRIPRVKSLRVLAEGGSAIIRPRVGDGDTCNVPRLLSDQQRLRDDSTIQNQRRSLLSCKLTWSIFVDLGMVYHLLWFSAITTIDLTTLTILYQEVPPSAYVCLGTFFRRVFAIATLEQVSRCLWRRPLRVPGTFELSLQSPRAKLVLSVAACFKLHFFFAQPRAEGFGNSYDIIYKSRLARFVRSQDVILTLYSWFRWRQRKDWPWVLHHRQLKKSPLEGSTRCSPNSC